jgi:site-specific DNA-cytosine methylase
MNVLSLFDGISAGRIALERAGVSVDNFYSSEIDEHAIKVTQRNHPSTIQLGDVTQVFSKNLPKIDLLIGGSPCQSFSKAGNGQGFDGKSGLFWEYVRILNEVKPTYFLLENVIMKKEWEDIITEALGVSPIRINSNLLSAQNRPRQYWTNIEGVEQPDDKGILLKDIILTSFDEKTGEEMKKMILSDKANDYMGRLRNGKPRWEYHKNPLDGKAACLTANMYKGVPYGVVKELVRRLHPIECERLQTFPDGYTEGISMTQRFKAIGNSWTVDVIAHIFKGLK